ncbi:MerR family transcriptional regulator [Chitinimonas arctica]|uniref:MerR family transcriptional regulator n=1 Tax=Chitinimonas arctica TaxID=2594795 RepID=A0A516SGC6_9NEIS|nr:MerR family transcriptional regulator [Chitinimonas arctica]QDQ27150.1 MerR family transcriptional regulator [Chitinimonas arctica]
MRLKIGELARRTGITVRALHHYDAVGLLTPSVRSDAGYRLYSHADVARLHQIQALRQLGLSLAEIGNFIESEGAALPLLIERQMQALDRQMAENAILRERLARLRDALQHQAATGQSGPDLSEWLTTLEQMTMHDKYFTPQEQRELRDRYDEDARQAEQEWPALVARARQLMNVGVTPDDPAVQVLAKRWMEMLQQFIGGNPALAPNSMPCIGRSLRYTSRPASIRT